MLWRPAVGDWSKLSKVGHHVSSDGPLERTTKIMQDTACHNVEALKLFSHTDLEELKCSYRRVMPSQMPTLRNIGRLHLLLYALIISTAVADFSDLKESTRRVVHVLTFAHDTTDFPPSFAVCAGNDCSYSHALKSDTHAH